MPEKKDKMDKPGDGPEFMPPALPPSSGANEPPTEEEMARDRKLYASVAELNPLSLVGSWFLRFENSEVVQMGVVVGQTTSEQQQFLLCEVNGNSLDGSPRLDAQVLLPLVRFVSRDEGYECRFYDSEEKMRTAFIDLATTAKDRREVN